jgi:WD40 repeat protein
MIQKMQRFTSLIVLSGIAVIVLLWIPPYSNTEISLLNADWKSEKDFFLGPDDVSVSPTGKIFIVATGKTPRVYKQIYIFNESGRFEKVLDIGLEEMHPEIGWVNLFPMRLEVAPDGNLVVSAGYNKRCVVYFFFPNGDLIKYWKFPVKDCRIIDFDIAPDGTIFSCNSNRTVTQLSTDGQVLRKWGSKGSGNGQFAGLLAIAVGDDGSVFTYDIGYTKELPGHRVQKFNTSGNFITSWGGDGNFKKGNWQGEIGTVTGMDVAHDGTLFLAHLSSRDYRIQEIRHYSATGTLINKWGEYGKELGRFYQTGDPCVGSDGNIYVPDIGNNKIQVFSPNGVCIWVLEGDPSKR